ncbi:hypothetical protein ACH5RR_024721 [Cinchona calisaya]|uniref:Uncharacterized protein n=1 Tax=Cinchona calisaya TaxID=153742 RepID=A0ABD2Z081_9GENT
MVILIGKALHLNMQKQESDSSIGTRTSEPVVDSETTNSWQIWDYSDSEVVPASSWTTLPNRLIIVIVVQASTCGHLLCRPLPVDIGGKSAQLDNYLSKLLAFVTHMSIKAWIPEHQSIQLKNITQHINGLPMDWKEKMNKVHQLFSRVPHYKKTSNDWLSSLLHLFGFYQFETLLHNIITLPLNNPASKEEVNSDSLVQAAMFVV